MLYKKDIVHCSLLANALTYVNLQIGSDCKLLPLTHTHLLSLQGTVVALDKIRSKMEKIIQNAKMLKLDCIKAYCCNSIHAVSADPAQEYSAGKPLYFKNSVTKHNNHSIIYILMS